MKEGHNVVGYYDHHWPEPGRTKIITELSKRLDVLNNVEHLNYVTRQEALSATELVPDGEWHDKFIDVVFFDLDIDGFLGFLRGCGVDYPKIVNDASIADSPNGNGCLSDLGHLLLNSKFLAPHKDANHPEYFSILEKVYSRFVDRVNGNMSVLEQMQHKQEIQEAVVKAQNSKKINEIIEGGHIDTRKLVADALRHFEDQESVQAVACTFLRIQGDHGVRIDLQHKCRIDLQRVWPKSNTSFRCTCLRSEFSKFARAWAMATGHVFGKRGRKAS